MGLVSTPLPYDLEARPVLTSGGGEAATLVWSSGVRRRCILEFRLTLPVTNWSSPMPRFAALLVLACIHASTARASDIVVSAQANAPVCTLTMEAGIPTTVYALAVLSGDAAEIGIYDAEFRIHGFDPAWAVVSRPNAAATSDIGNPVDNGCVLSFTTCERPVNQIVLLYTMTVIPFTVTPGRMVFAYGPVKPTNPNFPCASLLACNLPNPTRICVPGAVSCINAAASCCISPIESTSWSQVKALYTR